MRDIGHLLNEALSQSVQCGGPRHQRSYAVEGFESHALFLKLRGLFGDFAFEIAIHGLQVFSHAVETGSERCELIVASRIDARTEIPLLNLLNSALDLPYRLQHEHVAGVEQCRRSQHR